jgi:hypothetical protein
MRRDALRMKNVCAARRGRWGSRTSIDSRHMVQDLNVHTRHKHAVVLLSHAIVDAVRVRAGANALL